MIELTQDEKKEQYEAFFMIEHPLNVNVERFAHVPPSFSEFEAMIPHAFRLSGQFSSLDTAAIRQLQSIGEHADALAAFLNAQAKKIDWMMSYILEQQDDPQVRHQATKFGGAGIEIKSSVAWETGALAQLKLFVPTEHSAVFCLGEVIACEANQDEYHIAFLLTHIREPDQEILVRATLHLQTQQLRARHQASHSEHE